MKIAFTDAAQPPAGYLRVEKDILEDRGSRYAVTVAYAAGKHDLQNVLATLCIDPYFKNADHNSWAMTATHEGVRHEFASDDGETGAGKVILRELQKADMVNIVAVVTRHFGGIKLERDRYAHIQTAVRHGITALKKVVVNA